jgi:general secretion pathway protein F
MTRFKVRSVGAGDSAVREEVLEFVDERALVQAVQAQGRTVLQVARARDPMTLRRAHPDFALFCRELRTLIVAGMTVVEAVDTLASVRSRQGQGNVIASALLTRLEQGQALSAALASLSGVPTVLVAAVKSGERTSNLAEALDDYLRFDSLVRQLRQKVISASIYPALVTSLGVAISVFLLVVVLPNFARMYQNLRGGSRGATAFMIEISSVVSAHQPEVLVGLAVLVVTLALWASGDGPRWLLQVSVRRIPWLRDRVRDFQLAMLYQALALMLKGGYPLTEAMKVAGLSALSSDLQTGAGEALAHIESGGSVSTALFANDLCDEVGRRLMAAAERNGDFHLAADTVSRLHGERFEVFVERATRIVEPLLLLAVALMVGTIVVMMYLPVFDMATQLR